MATRLPRSQHGEGVGGPVTETDDPNNPSFDPATHNKTDDKIRYLLDKQLTQWEREFLMQVYGQVPLSRKQHIRIAKIYGRCTQTAAAPGCGPTTVVKRGTTKNLNRSD